MFKCKNPNCIRFDIETTVDTFCWPYKTQEEQEKDKICQSCSCVMEWESEELNNKAPIQLKFNSMSDADKKKMLKKRAKDHMDKNNFKETKLQKRAEAVGKYFNYGNKRDN